MTFTRRISIIQSRWTKAVEMEKYKKALLLEIWDREFKSIPMNAIKSKDKKMKKYAQDIMLIKKDVK